MNDLNGLYGIGKLGTGRLAGNVVIAVGHAVYGEEEALLGNGVEAGLVNKGMVHSCLINSHGNVGPFGAGGNGLGFDRIEVFPDKVEEVKLSALGLRSNNVFCQSGSGDRGKHHKHCKRYAKETFNLHRIIFLSIWICIFYHSLRSLSLYKKPVLAKKNIIFWTWTKTARPGAFRSGQMRLIYQLRASLSTISASTESTIPSPLRSAARSSEADRLTIPRE